MWVPLIFMAVCVFVAYAVVNRPKPKPPTKMERFLDFMEDVIPVVVQVAELVWSQIEAWLENNRAPGTLSKLVRENIDNGDVTVIANVLSGGRSVASNAWQARKLSPDLERLFGNRDEIFI